MTIVSLLCCVGGDRGHRTRLDRPLVYNGLTQSGTDWNANHPARSVLTGLVVWALHPAGLRGGSASTDGRLLGGPNIIFVVVPLIPLTYLALGFLPPFKRLN